MLKDEASPDELRRLQALLDRNDDALDREELPNAEAQVLEALGLSYRALPDRHRAIVPFKEFCSTGFVKEAAAHSLSPYQWAQVRTVVRQSNGKVAPRVFVADGPRGLLVRGDLLLSECPALSTLPVGLTVGRHLDLGYCTALASLPEALSVNEDLTLFDCTALRGLPDDLVVGAALVIDGCPRVVIEDAKRLKQAGRVGGELFYNS